MNIRMPSSANLFRTLAAGISIAAVTGCSALRPAATATTAFYTLDSAAGARRATDVGRGVPESGFALLPILIVNPPHAAAGFDGQRIIYTRKAHKAEYFANSEWVDPPARMLAPLVVSALENSGAFRAAVLTPSAATGDLRLDVELVRLQQEFDVSPSRVRLTLRAHLVDDKTRGVLAWKEFEAVVPAGSEDPYGGVVAANVAVAAVLGELSAFCAEVARGMPKEK